MITIDSLSHRYSRSGDLALDSVSATIRPGAITGLIGPNGSGKTTLMRALAGLLPETSGTICIDATPIPVDHRIAYCAYTADGTDLGEYRIHQVLAFAKARSSWDQALFDHLAQRFNIRLKGRADKRSTGQRSMLGASLALASGAPILLLDEVQSGMDVPSRYAFYEEIIGLAAERQRTVIVSTHLVSELETLIEDLLILKSGRLLAATTAEDLRSRVTALVGPASVLSSFSFIDEGVTVLSTRSLGPALEATIDGLLSPTTLSRLSELGVQSHPVSFQDAFVSLLKEEIQ